MNIKANTNNLTWLIIAMIFVNVIAGYAIYNKEVSVEVPEINVPQARLSEQDKTDIIDGVISKLPSQSTPGEVMDTEPLDNDKINALYEDSDLDEEFKAEELVMAELNSRDFKRQLQDYINDAITALEDIGDIGDIGHDQYGLKIDRYRDIQDVYSIDVEDVYVNGTNDETFHVEVEFKVKYILDDDEDEEASARLTVLYTVGELNDDDDFKDSEVFEDFTLLKLKLYG